MSRVCCCLIAVPRTSSSGRKMGTPSGVGMAAGLPGSPSAAIAGASSFFPTARQALSFPVWPRPPLCPLRVFSPTRLAKGKDSYVEPVLKQPATREVEKAEQVVTEDEKEEEDDDDGFVDEFEDEMLLDEDEDFVDDFEGDDADPYVGDGAAGGGVSLAGMWWDKEALAIAEDVSKSFDGDLKIYAFKTYANSLIRVRIEKLSSKYGSPSLTDIEEFSSVYQERLNEAEQAGTIPQNISLEKG